MVGEPAHAERRIEPAQVIDNESFFIPIKVMNSNSHVLTFKFQTKRFFNLDSIF